MDRSKADLVLQFILLTAGREDEYRDRPLGPIHLIKYVYLADLLYASQHNGQTYTEAAWRFYNYGPWEQRVHARIDPALAAIGADKQTFQSDYEENKDWFRWQLSDDQLFYEKMIDIPMIIKGRLPLLIHKFGKSTPDLLDYIYSTAPMRNAAPNELLDFSFAAPPQKIISEEVLTETHLSARKKKKLKEGMGQLKERFAAEKAKGLTAKQGFIDSPIEPRYDDVYFAGLEWLDSLAGAALSEGAHEAVFSENIWKSSARVGNDVS